MAALYSSHLEVKYDHFSVDVPVDMVGRVALSTLAAGGCVWTATWEFSMAMANIGYACGVLSCFVGATREFTWDFRHCGVVGLASSVVRDLAGFA